MTEMTSAYRTFRVTRRADGLDILTLNRPPINPMSEAMFDELGHYFTELRANQAVRVVVLRSTGHAFCAGLDLTELDGATPATGAASSATAFTSAALLQRKVSDVPRFMQVCPQPIICCVQGAAAGGGFGLALASDVRLATHAARFNVAMIKIGLSGLDIGISYHLPRLIGASVASEFILTGRFMSAERALRSGLVSELFETQESMDEAALALAAEMLACSPAALRYTKEGLICNIDAPSLESALATEDKTQVLLSVANAAEISRRMASYVRKPRRARLG